MSGSERAMAGAWSSASAVVATTLAVLGPDAVGGAGPVERPVLGLDLLDGSTLGQFAALAVILLPVWALAQIGVIGHRASVVAAAASAISAQPLLGLVNESVMATSARFSSLDGWLSGAAIAATYSLTAVALLVSVDAVLSVMAWLARTLIDSVALLVAFFARSEPTLPSRPCPPPHAAVVVERVWADHISMRGPPRARVLASA